MGDLTDQAKDYHAQLNDEARAYYEKEGLTEGTINEFGLGWVVEPVSEAHERFRGQPVFPYFSVQGTVTWMRASVYEYESNPVRTLDETVMGHSFPVSTVNRHVYNVRHALPGMRTSRVWLTDSLHATHLLRQAGERACAVPRWGDWRDAWAELFASADVILVGHRQMEDLLGPIRKQFRRLKTRVTPVVLDGSTSVGDLLLSGETPSSISGVGEGDQVG